MKTRLRRLNLNGVEYRWRVIVSTLGTAPAEVSQIHVRVWDADKRGAALVVLGTCRNM